MGYSDAEMQAESDLARVLKALHDLSVDISMREDMASLATSAQELQDACLTTLTHRRSRGASGSTTIRQVMHEAKARFDAGTQDALDEAIWPEYVIRKEE